MNIFVRVGRLILTFAIFIVAQALLAASINSMFELVPIKIDRIFPRDKSATSVDSKATVDAKATGDAEESSLLGRLEDDANRVRQDLSRRKIERRKEKYTVPTMLTGSMTSSAVMDTTGVTAAAGNSTATTTRAVVR